MKKGWGREVASVFQKKGRRSCEGREEWMDGCHAMVWYGVHILRKQYERGGKESKDSLDVPTLHQPLTRALKK